MAETYRNATAAVGTALADVYTCPAATTAIVLLCQAANVDTAVSADVNVALVDTSAAVTRYLARAVTVPAKASLNVLDSQRLVLETGDKIQAAASAAGDIELVVSVLEIT